MRDKRTKNNNVDSLSPAALEYLVIRSLIWWSRKYSKGHRRNNWTIMIPGSRTLTALPWPSTTIHTPPNLSKGISPPATLPMTILPSLQVLYPFRSWLYRSVDPTAHINDDYIFQEKTTLQNSTFCTSPLNPFHFFQFAKHLLSTQSMQPPIRTSRENKSWGDNGRRRYFVPQRGRLKAFLTGSFLCSTELVVMVVVQEMLVMGSMIYLPLTTVQHTTIDYASTGPSSTLTSTVDTFQRLTPIYFREIHLFQLRLNGRIVWYP